VICPHPGCGKSLHPAHKGEFRESLQLYFSPPGHDHDDNCRGRIYGCEDGHRIRVCVRRTCPAPGCDWKGKTTCFCHPGEKLDRWPEEKKR